MSEAAPDAGSSARDDRIAAARDREVAALLLYQAELAREGARVHRENAALDLHQARLIESANETDALTGALQRGPGIAALKREVDRARRTRNRLVIGFVDVDALKHVNDTAGHTAGDRILRAVVDELKSSLRSYDVVVRYGGDEFLYSLAGADVAAAAQRFLKMRMSFEQSHGDTVSAGFAALRDRETLGTLITRADLDMYRRRAQSRSEMGS